VLAALLALTVAVFQPFLVALLWAAVIVTATDRWHRVVLRWVGNRRGAAAALMTVLVLLLIITPFAFIAAKFVGEAHEFVVDGIPEIEKTLHERLQDPDSWLTRSKAWAEQTLRTPISFEFAPEFFEEWFTGTRGSAALGVARGVLAGLFTTLASVFFLVLSLFYLYRDGPLAVHVARELIPLQPRDRELVLGELRDAVNAAVRGGLVTAIVQGTLGGIILAVLGIDGAIFWGSVMALASLIPMVGTALVWGPIAVFLVWQGSPWKATILVGYGVLVIGTADNLLRPILVGQHMKAHSLLLFFGIIGSILLFGFKGIVLGPIVVACITATTTLFRREFKRTQAPTPD